MQESPNIDFAFVHRYITETFKGVEVSEHLGDCFYIYDPDHKLSPKKKMPFATLVNSDNYDRVSNLSRPSVFRLNIGVSKDSYRALLGEQPAFPEGDGVVDTGHDFSTLDQIMPHPTYASASWICVLNPSATTFETIRVLLDEAYQLGVERYASSSRED